MKYLIANWKAQMTKVTIESWLDEFISLSKKNNNLLQSLVENKLRIIIAPPFPYLSFVKEKLEVLPNIKIASQTVSNVVSGKFTGEVTAQMVKDFCDYSIIGHSERRSNYGENEMDILTKISNAEKSEIESILCIRNVNDIVYPNANLIAYEPPDSIGTGNNAPVKSVLEIKNNIKLYPNQIFLYGASVDEVNMQDYLNTNEIFGLLVGTASLDPIRFYNMATKMI